MVLPSELRWAMERFEAFYAGKYQGRRLLWAHSLERCVVAARFPRGKKDLEVSLFQVCRIIHMSNSPMAGVEGICCLSDGLCCF